MGLCIAMTFHMYYEVGGVVVRGYSGTKPPVPEEKVSWFLAGDCGPRLQSSAGQC